MVETISHSEFNFSSDYTPSYSFASTMRACYANNSKISSSVNSSSSDSSSSSRTNSTSSNSPNLKASSNLESRRSSCNEMYLRNLDHNCSNKRCSNTITTTCLNSCKAKNQKQPKLQLTTTTIEDNENKLLSSCTTQLSTPQSLGMISQKHQFSYDQLGQQMSRMPTSGAKSKRSESLYLSRQYSTEVNDNNNNLLTSSFDDTHENSNSSEDDFVFGGELSSSPSQHNHHQMKNGRNGPFALCKRCNGSNSSLSNTSLTSFSSISSSVSSNNNLNQYTLTNNNSTTGTLNPPDNLINNLSHSLNQTFSFAANNHSNNLTPQFGRSRHNSINSLSLSNNSQQSDRNLHALHKALHNIFSN